MQLDFRHPRFQLLLSQRFCSLIVTSRRGFPGSVLPRSCDYAAPFSYPAPLIHHGHDPVSYTSYAVPAQW